MSAILEQLPRLTDNEAVAGYVQIPAEIIGIGLAKADIGLIERAYAVAAYWHRDQ